MLTWTLWYQTMQPYLPKASVSQYTVNKNVSITLGPVLAKSTLMGLHCIIVPHSNESNLVTFYSTQNYF